jgi:hypothetical protein
MFLYHIHADNHCSMCNVLFVHTIHIIFIHNDDSTYSFFIKFKCSARFSLNKNVQLEMLEPFPQKDDQ